MDMVESVSSSCRGSGRIEPLAPVTKTTASRRVNFTSTTAQEKMASGSYTNSSASNYSREVLESQQGPRRGVSTHHSTLQSVASLRSSSPLKRSHSRSNGMNLGLQQKSETASSLPHVQSTGSAQGSQSSEPEFLAYPASAVFTTTSRISPFASKTVDQVVESDFSGHSGYVGARRSGGFERILGMDMSSAYERNDTPVGTGGLRQALNALKEATDMEEAEEMHNPTDLQDPLEEKGDNAMNEAVAEKTWRRRTTRTSTHYPICVRTARERCAYTTSDDWAIFAMHSQHVRPLRDREWVPGEPCIIQKDSFELPPGACRYSESTSGLPATAFNSFVFPNPPRQFLMPTRGSSGCFEVGGPSAGFRAGRARQADRRRSAQLTQEQLLDLERMLWFDPEPRLERPFRLYADSKACLKGPIHDIGQIMRSGW